MQSRKLDAHALYNPYAYTDPTNPTASPGQPMPVSEPFLAPASTPKQSKETQSIQEHLADGNPYVILDADLIDEKMIDLTLKFDDKKIEAIALVTKPERLQALKTNNIISIYLFTKATDSKEESISMEDSDSTESSISINVENRLDLKPEYMEAFKKRIIEAISGSTKPLKAYPKKSPSSGRSFREESLHSEVKPIVVA